MNDWHIQARARTCQGCGKAFPDREAYHTLLFEQRSGFERLDVCGACWETQHRHGATDRKGFISHWQGTHVVPPPPTPEAIGRDDAETLLRRLIERNDPAWQPASFILAVMLERKRVLRNREQVRQDGRRTFVYELLRTGEVFLIVDPSLQLDQLAQVQHDVAQLLEHGLPAEAQPIEEPFVPVVDPHAPGLAPGDGEGEWAEGGPGPGGQSPVSGAAEPPVPAPPVPATEAVPV